MDSEILRMALERTERAVAGFRLPGGMPAGVAALEELETSLAELVRALALEPRNARRDCPTCGTRVMRAATLCGHCWAKLTPPSPANEK